MKYFLIGATLILAMLGLVFYGSRMHTACIISLLLALGTGALFTTYLNRQYIKNIQIQDQIRQRLSADVAHELRTPISALSANLEAILEGAMQASPERIEACYQQVQRLGSLVADMERLATAESDVQRLKKESVDLLAFVQETFPEASGPSLVVPIDKQRMQQVLINLKNNGEKHGNGVTSVTLSDSGKVAEIRVSDQGPGIAAKDLPYIFERFYRADQSRNRASGTAGLGLTIVKTIVEAHGGKVKAESETGKGSCFIITLPKN